MITDFLKVDGETKLRIEEAISIDKTLKKEIDKFLNESKGYASKGYALAFEEVRKRKIVENIFMFVSRTKHVVIKKYFTYSTLTSISKKLMSEGA